MEIKTGRKCDVCSKPSPFYTCPRCNIFYCNLSCYQAPGHASCSESFYQDEVVNELKNCKINDRNKPQIADILRRDLERVERDNYGFEGPESSTESDLEDEKEASEINPDEMIRVYESEIRKWQPWWVSDTNLVRPITQEDSPKLALNNQIIQNSSTINVSNANKFFYNEIIRTSFFYIIITYVYQLTKEDFESLSESSIEIDSELIDEICSAYLEIENLANKKQPVTDLGHKLELIMASILQEENLFLKSYVDKQLFGTFLQDLINFCQHPILHQSAQSHLYSLFQAKMGPNIKTASGEHEPIERPLNVFHTKAKPKSRNPNSKKPPVEIIGEPIKKQDADPKVSAKKESRLFLKKLEFRFKWMSVNLNSVKKQETIDSVCSTIWSVRDSIYNDVKDFDARKALVDANLDFIRKKINSNKKLIEEI